MVAVCGGYARICVHCGLCGKVPARPLAKQGACPLCGRVVAPGETRCPVCGVPIPKAPGAPPAASSAPSNAQYKEGNIRP